MDNKLSETKDLSR